MRELEAAGIAFTIASSRPPVGMRMFVEPLGLRHPIGAFNGGAILDPDGTVLEQHLIPQDAASRAVAAFRDFGAEIWVFADGLWLLDQPDGHFVPRESHTIEAAPVTVADFGPHLAGAGKIVAASQDHAGLARLEAELRAELGTSAEVARSQPYYLDVTPPGVDKGTLVSAIARRLGIPLADVLHDRGRPQRHPDVQGQRPLGRDGQRGGRREGACQGRHGLERRERLRRGDPTDAAGLNPPRSLRRKPGCRLERGAGSRLSPG